MAQRYQIWLVLGLSILLLVFHSINITADTSKFAYYDTGLYVDEGYKTLSPKNLVLFGSTKWSKHDEYNGWFKGSPLTQSILYISFKIFKPSLLVARATALTYFFILSFIILWTERNHLSLSRYAIISFLLATEPFLFFFSRVALFEVAIAMLLAIGLTSIRYFDLKGLWFILLVALIGYSLIKESVLLYLFPAIFILALFTLRTIENHKVSIAIGVTLFSIISICIFLSYHTLLSQLGSISMSSSHFPRRLIGNPLAVFSPWVCGAVWLCIYDILRRTGYKIFDDTYFLVLSATVIGGPILLSFFSHDPPRYFVPLIPAYILMIAYWLEKPQMGNSHKMQWLIRPFGVIVLYFAAITISRGVINLILQFTSLSKVSISAVFSGTERWIFLSAAILVVIAFDFISYNWPSRRDSLIRITVSATLSLAILVGSWQIIKFWSEPSFSSNGVRQELRALVKPNEAIIGDWAPFFALGTHIPAIYSTNNLNEGNHILSLCPTYYLFSGTPGDEAVVKSYEKIHGLSLSKAITLGKYHGKKIYLYKINYPNGQCKVDELVKSKKPISY